MSDTKGIVVRGYGLVSVLSIACLVVTACVPSLQYDLVIRNGTVYDGSGSQGFVGDVAVNGDAIAAIGSLGKARGQNEIDATGLAVSPGFINMMCWANESLIEDGRSQSDIRQGVTLEVLGEGSSMGPLNEAMKEEKVRRQDDIKYDVEWTTLDEYLVYLEERGVSANVASFVGAETPREYVIGHEDRAPTPEELEEMRGIVRTAMEEGALGVASSLIYPPGSFARLLGRYVRDERLIPIEEAIRKLAALPAENLKIDRRGMLKEGYYADIVVFDPDTIQDHATFVEPHQYATGVAHVFVNGVQVIEDGEHTGVTPGRVVRGPGWSGE
jgi:N-acyl-D-aspartate/D-glutamate deacylase